MDQVYAEVAIRQMFQDIKKACHLGDVMAFAACFSSQATFLLPDGRCLHGREAIQRAWETAGQPKCQCAVSAFHITHVADDVAVVTMAGNANASQAHQNYQWHSSWTAVKTAQGDWKVVSAQVCAIPEHIRHWYDTLFGWWPKRRLAPY